ncbi:MAG TPA: flagellar basal body rod protein FlgB [Stellaceae bacterium]|jgi:flagellar basal-body rod protein FlgB
MDLGNIPLFRALTQRMSWLGDRQNVLAQNVANVDTPGYVPQDLKAPSFRELVRGGSGGSAGHLALATTSPEHLAGQQSSTAFRKQAEPGAQRVPSGNAVSVEEEMMKISETASDHQLVTSLYKDHIAMIKAVLGRSA